MAAEGRRAAPDVDGDVEDGPVRHAQQLALRGRRDLKVKAAPIPASEKARSFHTSEKNPRVSPMRCGNTILMSGSEVSMNFTDYSPRWTAGARGIDWIFVHKKK
jgi:hypothetical protein